LIKFFLISPKGSLNLSVILNMPMKLGLKLMASVYPNREEAEREFLNHTIDKDEEIKNHT